MWWLQRECVHVCLHVCVCGCAGELSAFGCLLTIIMTSGDSLNQSSLIMYCNKCLAWIKGVSRFLFRPSKETCYYSIVSGISGNPGKCPDMSLLKIKLSGFLTVKTLLTVGFRLSDGSILRFQLWKDLCNKRCLHLFYKMNSFFPLSWIKCIVYFSVVFVKQLQFFTHDS